MKNKFVKKLAAVATVATMVMGMSVSAFAVAEDTTTLATNLYKDGKYYLGVGGGITAESDLEFEYEETLQKAKAVLLAMR